MKKFLISALATGLLLTACSPGDVESPTPVPSMSVVEPTPSPSPTASEEPSPTPSPDPSPDPTSTLSPEQQEAVETVLEYFRIYQAVRSDLEADFQPLADITRDQIRRIHVDEIAENRSRGWVQRGIVDIRIVGVWGVEQREDGDWVTIAACSDSTRSDMVDISTGESVLGRDREEHIYWVLELVREGSHWQVANGGSEVRDPCN